MCCRKTQSSERRTVDPERQVKEDLLCSRCGYNLRTRRAAGRCPECGQTVSETLKVIRRFGPGGRRAYFWRLAAVNVGTAYLPGLFYVVLLAPLIREGYAWAFAAVTPLGFPMSEALRHMSYGANAVPLFAGAALLSLVVILVVTYHGVGRDHGGCRYVQC
jgi:predicted RNA-binding Zn-ribbon protein involved in translation (DUF1610 family)